MGTVLQDIQHQHCFSSDDVSPLTVPSRKLGSPPALSPLNQSWGWEPLGPSALTQGLSIP